MKYTNKSCIYKTPNLIKQLKFFSLNQIKSVIKKLVEDILRR